MKAALIIGIFVNAMVWPMIFTIDDIKLVSTAVAATCEVNHEV